MHRNVFLVAAGLTAPLGTASALADVFNMPAGQTSLELVPVGNAGNANHPVMGFGGVPYNYSIGKFEITIGQYSQFLNAVAATDTYELYNSSMADDFNIAGIARSGVSGGYTYSAIGSPNRPIAYVSWGDAARFANWITNGQPAGAQGPGTTETGSYALNGATTSAALNAVTREPNGRFFIPTEDEWYKAAYYDPTKGGSNYWLYPMRTDAVPCSDQPPGSTSPNPVLAGNFYNHDGLANSYNDGYAITGSTSYSRSANYLSNVGAYTFALSYYGTFDQGGNLWEWNEALVSDSFRGFRGGSWGSIEFNLWSGYRNDGFAASEGNKLGFRVSEVPEPGSILLFALASMGVIRRRRRQTLRAAAEHAGVLAGNDER